MRSVDTTDGGTKMKRLLVGAMTVALGLGVFATQSVSAGARTVKPAAITLSGVTVTCTNISGFITETPGITTAPVGAGGAVFKWQLKAVATGCTAPPNSAGVVLTIAGAVITEKGSVRDPAAPNRCVAALGAPGTFTGAGGSKIQWISSPAVANTVLTPGTLGAPATIDTVGLEIHWPIAPGLSLDLGGDYPAPVPCPAGPLPSTSMTFGTPSTHTPVVLAVL